MSVQHLISEFRLSRKGGPAEIQIAQDLDRWEAISDFRLLRGSSANWTRLSEESALGFNAGAAVHGASNPLLAAEVALGRLD